MERQNNSDSFFNKARVFHSGGGLFGDKGALLEGALVTLVTK